MFKLPRFSLVVQWLLIIVLQQVTGIQAQENEFTGVLQRIEDERQADQPIQYYLAKDDQKFYLIAPSRFNSQFKELTGKTVTVRGGKALRTLPDGSSRNEIRVVSFVVPVQRSRVQSAAERKKYEFTQSPLTDDERLAAVKEFGKGSKILDENLKLIQALEITEHRLSRVKWVFQPDGSFIKRVYLPSFGSSEEDAKGQIEGRGKLSTRQLVSLARVIKQQEMFELPSQIGEKIQMDTRLQRPERSIKSIRFGNFNTTGGRSPSATSEKEAYKRQNLRLLKVTSSFVSQARRNLKFQRTTGRRPKRK